jgi:probable HAF family extracellular repeat protein
MKRLLWGLAASALLLSPLRSPAGYLVTDLGYLGPAGSVIGMNNAGQVVAFSSSGGNSSAHAFLYGGGVMTDLGTLPGGTQTFPSGINDSGQVVGGAYTASG